MVKITLSNSPMISVSMLLQWLAIIVLLGLLTYSIVLTGLKFQNCGSYILTETDFDNIDSYLKSAGFFNNDKKIDVNAVTNLSSIQIKDIIRFYGIGSEDNLPHINFEVKPEETTPKTGKGSLKGDNTNYHWEFQLNSS